MLSHCHRDRLRKSVRRQTHLFFSIQETTTVTARRKAKSCGTNVDSCSSKVLWEISWMAIVRRYVVPIVPTMFDDQRRRASPHHDCRRAGGTGEKLHFPPPKGYTTLLWRQYQYQKHRLSTFLMRRWEWILVWFLCVCVCVCDERYEYSVVTVIHCCRFFMVPSTANNQKTNFSRFADSCSYLFFLMLSQIMLTIILNESSRTSLSLSLPCRFLSW